MGAKAVTAEGIGKQYKLGQLQTGYKLLSEQLVERLRQPRGAARETFWALRDIGFEIEAGESFGIIGHNGAGKSTLLKVLARVTPPTTGELHLRGRVGALLEVGTGFHAELTGRENIFLNGAILGMRRTEIARKFDEIVEFAEVAPFIDTPVKRYSSGMYLRLAFAVAAHLEPEILIVDEVLSVGDLAFQEKCLGRMQTVAGEGRTVLFVSHNLTAVRTLCSRAMLLSRGQKITEGTSSEVIEEYIRSVRTDAATPLTDRTDRKGTGRLRFRALGFLADGVQTDIPVTGRDTEIFIEYESPDGRPVKNAVFAIGIYTLLGELILQLQSDLTGAAFRELPPSGRIRCHVPRLPLPAGQYTMNLFATAAGDVADWVERASELTIAEGDFFGSGQRVSQSHETVLVNHDWSWGDADASPMVPAPAVPDNAS